ncbi:flagellar brake protein [Desulfobotulus sp. H1]|uniref:Flagellar brake protein n=1 Tax=Desulfobotulus pelophilus TaxID=2823377 RepID=A0ABT3N8A3_9BACT|nr:flagellar brake protein [Desulfobotulus pelophilus]MCW7753682.1 flagellar brake protein [Desulfobotulus pelophilus]
MTEDKTAAGPGFVHSVPTGASLTLKIEGIDIPLRIQSQVVGMIQDEYILITHPTPFATTKPKLFEGNRIIAQYQDKDFVYVFGVKILAFLVKPIRIVVLEYPDKILTRRIKTETGTAEG